MYAANGKILEIINQHRKNEGLEIIEVDEDEVAMKSGKGDKEDCTSLIYKYADVVHMDPGTSMTDCLNTLGANKDKKIIIFCNWFVKFHSKM